MESQSVRVGSCHRDLLDHVIAVNERHLRRLLTDYVGYYHDDRTHLGLGKGTPNNRPRSIASGRVLSHKRLGGLRGTVTFGLPSPKRLFVRRYLGAPHARAGSRLREPSRS